LLAIGKDFFAHQGLSAGAEGGIVQRRIGILGGTFNPIHYGHLAASGEVQERLNLDLVLFVPSFLPPHKREEGIPSAVQRLEMVGLAISGNPRFAASDIEVARGGRSYTIDTVEALRLSYPETRLFFITGLDSFLDIQTWRQWEKLLKTCSFVVLSRPGYFFSDLVKMAFMKTAARDLLALDRGEVKQALFQTEDITITMVRISHYDISSTDIRQRIREGRTIKYLLPEPVEHYIMSHTLYA
jgi:nicotinate-nucleotide adenylyltransferase